MNRKDFLLLCEIIREKRLFSEKKWSCCIGKKRQEKVVLALGELKKEGKIRDFLPAGDLSFSDVVRGIDFYAIYIDGAKYRTQPFSVTGKYWAEGDRKRHPEIPVIIVDTSADTSDSIKRKIMETMNHK